MTKMAACSRAGADGVPGMIRTCDLRFRKPLLYPAELRGLALCFFSRFISLASSLLVSLSVANAAPVPACFPQGGFTTRDAQAKTAKEIALADGETLLLAGIDVPDFVEARTLARVNELTARKPLRYAPLNAKPDRYARIAADVAVSDGTPLWLQGTLIEEGLALGMPVGLKSPCAAELMQIEKSARLNKVGIWSQPENVQIMATDHEALLKASGKFAIIEGRVLNVGARDYASFINFGRDYKQDFAVIVVKKHIAAIEAQQALATLKGKRVRVRGIVEGASAPRLHLEEPLALEVLE
jgi:micrococcal nuclease